MTKGKEIILLRVSGDDKPGVTNSLTAILANYHVNILDIGQAVIHENLALGILFEVPKESESSPILKDLLYKSYELGIKIKFQPISEDRYVDWVKEENKDRFIITILGKKLTASQFSEVSGVIFKSGLNIDQITRMSGRVKIKDTEQIGNSVVQCALSGENCAFQNLQRKFMDVSKSLDVDIAFQRDNVYRRNRRLVCFDMDSTLIQTEVIDELAKATGAGDEVSKITEAAMQGEIDFNESFVKRVSLLKGLDEAVLKNIAENLPLTQGSERLISTLKKYGYKTAILSGGFTYFGKYLQNKLGVDYVFANELEIKDGKLTGKHKGEIVNGQKKAELLRNLAFKEDIHLDQVIAVGDGSNDLPMINIAGLGIAFHAKPIVKENAQQSISTIGLDAILYLMGFRDREIEG